MAHAILVGSVTQPLTQQELVAIEGTVDYLRICADRLPARVSSDLNSRFQGDTVFSLRTDTHTTTSRQRIEKLLTAAVQYDLTELDAETDLVGEVLDSIPPSRRIIRWCGPARDWRVLYERFQRLEAIPAKYYVFVTEPSRNGDELVVLEFLSSIQRTDVTAYAQGPLGFWTRLLAPQVGAPLVFASVHESATACGEPSVHRLMTDYGFPNIGPISELFGIVGKSALQSLFPLIQNSAHRYFGRSAICVPFYAESYDDFAPEFLNGDRLRALGWPLKGLTIVSPLKEAASERAAATTPMAEFARSSNFLVRRDHGDWSADTSDPEGALLSLEHAGVSITAVDVAVVGCGGSGRSIAAAMKVSGANVTLVNRTLSRGRWASTRLGLPFVPLSEFDPGSYSIVVNATPVGRDGQGCPFPLDLLRADAVIVDLACGQQLSPLVVAVRSNGGKAVSGREVMVQHAVKQFRGMTGLEMDRKLAAKWLEAQSREGVLVSAAP